MSPDDEGPVLVILCLWMTFGAAMGAITGWWAVLVLALITGAVLQVELSRRRRHP